MGVLVFIGQCESGEDQDFIPYLLTRSKAELYSELLGVTWALKKKRMCKERRPEGEVKISQGLVIASAGWELWKLGAYLPQRPGKRLLHPNYISKKRFYSL